MSAFTFIPNSIKRTQPQRRCESERLQTVLEIRVKSTGTSLYIRLDGCIYNEVPFTVRVVINL